MQIRGTEFNALATDGDVRLGGYDWDQRLVDLVAETFHPPARRRSARRPGVGGQAVAGVRRRQADPLGPAEGRRGLRLSRRRHARSRSPGSSSRRPRRTCWTARGSPRVQTLQGGGPGLEGPRPRAAGGRLDPHADGPRHAPPAFRQGARRFGGGRRGGGPRRGPARLADPRPASGPAADASRSGTSTRTAWAWWASIR